MISFALPRYRLDTLWAESQEHYLAWALSSSHYPNTPWSHYIGRVGEEGVAELTGAKPQFRGGDIEPDLVGVGPHRLRAEVKTWTKNTWTRLGRCVTPRQLGLMEGRSVDIVVWAFVEFFNEGEVALVHSPGFTPLSLVGFVQPHETGPMRILNHQVPPEWVSPLDLIL